MENHQNSQTNQKDLKRLYDLYLHDVYKYCLYFTNNHAEAEDLTQDTFIKVMKSYPSFKGESSEKTWILSIARNTTVDYFRKRKIRDFLPDIFFSKTNDPLYDEPEQYSENKEEWEDIQHALRKLKPAYRNVVILRGLQELSIKETAAILQCKESKVKVDYHRALKQLQNYVSKHEEGGFRFHEDAK